jgi:carbonic anhydrase
MEYYDRILEFNRKWAGEMVAEDPSYFARHAKGQTPHTLFIGCSDSRVQTNTLTGTEQGEMFVHRNIANQVYSSDLNVLSALEFAVYVLDVKHIIVCGHYGCGGIKAASATEAAHGLIDHWLGQIRTIMRLHQDELDAITDPELRLDRLTELNVLEQVYNLSCAPVIRESWERGRRPIIHGVVYDIRTGLLKEVATRVDGPDKVKAILPSTAAIPTL